MRHHVDSENPFAVNIIPNSSQEEEKEHLNVLHVIHYAWM